MEVYTKDNVMDKSKKVYSFFSYLQIIYFGFRGGYYSVHLTQQKKNHLAT